MSGTKEGGKKAYKTNIERHGKDFYIGIGSVGGSKRHPETRWFAMHPELASKYGRKGGRISKRGKVVKEESVE